MGEIVRFPSNRIATDPKRPTPAAPAAVLPLPKRWTLAPAVCSEVKRAA